jgi:hypothetical protein
MNFAHYDRPWGGARGRYTVNTALMVFIKLHLISARGLRPRPVGHIRLVLVTVA